MTLGLLMTLYTIRTIQVLGEEETIKEPVTTFNNRRLPRTEILEENNNSNNNNNNNNNNAVTDGGGGAVDSSSSPCKCQERGTGASPTSLGMVLIYL